MLAVQRPRMVSSRLPDDMPFGYDFRQSSSLALPSPPVPAPGPSILDDNESKFLDSFFAGVNSDHFNFDFFTNAADGTDLALGWDELPPTLMGTSSSYGQQPQAPPPPPPPSQPGLSSMISGTTNTQSPTTMDTAPDVLAAAALLQNGPNGLRRMGEDIMFGNGHDPLLAGTSAIGSQSMAQYNPLSASSLRSPSAQTLHQRHSVPNSYLFGSAHDTLPRSNTRTRPPLQFGSDLSFGTTSGLVLSRSQMEAEALDRAQMQTVETFIDVLQNPSTADSTRPPSPLAFAAAPRPDHNDAYKESDDRPRKRRKSTLTQYEDDDDDDGDYPNPSPVQRSNGAASHRRSAVKPLSGPIKDSPSPTGHKRRKSSTQQAINAASRLRENLTENQKRENHIRSEQKRRTLIREGFEDLNELVPGLKQGGFSKSAVLTMAADWLEDLIQGNERLRERCDELSGRRRGGGR